MLVRANRIAINFLAQVKMFFRSPGAVFWTVAFPVLLILLFGALFSASGATTYNLYVQDLDNTQESHDFTQALAATKVLNVIEVDQNVSASQYIKDHSIASFLILPKDFRNALLYGEKCHHRAEVGQFQQLGEQREHGGHGDRPGIQSLPGQRHHGGEDRLPGDLG